MIKKNEDIKSNNIDLLTNKNEYFIMGVQTRIKQKNLFIIKEKINKLIDNNALLKYDNLLKNKHDLLLLIDEDKFNEICNIIIEFENEVEKILKQNNKDEVNIAMIEHNMKEAMRTLIENVVIQQINKEFDDIPSYIKNSYEFLLGYNPDTIYNILERQESYELTQQESTTPP